MTTTVDTERRTFTASILWDDPEQRSTADRVVRGHAAVFGEVADLGTFTEEISPGAFRRALANPATDPYLLMGHDSDKILAKRSAGTLEIREDNHGLAFTADLVSTTLGDDVLELVRTGHLTTCSFAFTVEADSWEQRDSRSHRTITEIGRLYELTLTGIPAYAGTSVRELLEARQATTATRGRLKVREPSPYGVEGGKYSYFLDVAVVARSAQVRHELIDQAVHIDRPSTGWQQSPAFEQDALDPERAARRLQHGAEQRTMSTTATAGGNFDIPTAPPYVGSAFATAARAAAKLAGILPVQPLPPTGTTTFTPRLTTGLITAVQSTENSSLGTQDFVEAKATSNIATIGGYADLSVQLFERAEPSMIDTVLATELGRSLATSLDQQLLGGTNANGQLMGLITVSGITSTAYTDSSATQQEAFVKVLQAASDLSIAMGDVPTAVILHPRRLYWFTCWRDSSTSGPTPAIPWPAETYTCGAIPTNLGASTSEDYLLVLRVEELPVLLGDVVIEAMPEVGSANATTRVVARQYASTLFSRRPEAIAKVSGTGMIAPVFA